MSTQTIASGSADGDKSTIADDQGTTQTVDTNGWQDTLDALDKCKQDRPED